MRDTELLEAYRLIIDGQHDQTRMLITVLKTLNSIIDILTPEPGEASPVAETLTALIAVCKEVHSSQERVEGRIDQLAEVASARTRPH